MKRRVILALALALAGITASGTACTSDNGSKELLVFVASSMTDAAEEVGEIFERESGVEVAFSFGASQSLARQAADGAPADVILTAGRFPMDFLVEGAHIAYGPVPVLSNELVVVVGPDRANIEEFTDLLEPEFEIVALADPELAPAGRYAKEALEAAGLWETIRPRIVWGGDVRAALAYVETGIADAAIVYRTDAMIAERVVIALAVPDGTYGPVTYPAAVLASAPLPTEARLFLEFLSSERAQSAFRKHGFLTLE